MGRKTTHVTPHGKGEWQVKRGGAQKASGIYSTKAEAVKVGREISRNQKSEFLIHNKDGKIAQADSHGNDPIPPRDKK